MHRQQNQEFKDTPHHGAYSNSEGNKKGNKMTFWHWIENRVARMNALDIALLKICVLAFGLMVAKLWPPLLTPDWKVFGAIFLITYIPLAVRLLIRKD